MKFLKKLTQKFKDIQTAAEIAHDRACAKTASDIMFAAEKGDMETLHDFFKNASPDVSQSSAAAYALVAACGGGQKSTVTYLLELGVPVCTSRTGLQEPVAYAAIGGHNEIITLLYEHAVKTGETPSPLLQQERDKVEQAALKMEMRDAGTLKKSLQPMKPLSMRKTPANS
ncbi:MAG TPA: ankyrin repeat domain-containing protein [Alphaproteobacteria bacterium]|nr:ankyrin repeat domain-containing protein [Alphaproteobacteria bacterium]